MRLDARLAAALLANSDVGYSKVDDRRSLGVTLEHAHDPRLRDAENLNLTARRAKNDSDVILRLEPGAAPNV